MRINKVRLSQAISKLHMEHMTGEKIDDEEWIAFWASRQFIDYFANEVSILARQYWRKRSMYMEMEE